MVDSSSRSASGLSIRALPLLCDVLMPVAIKIRLPDGSQQSFAGRELGRYAVLSVASTGVAKSQPNAPANHSKAFAVLTLSQKRDGAAGRCRGE